MQAFSRVSKTMEASHATALLEQKNKALKEMEEYVKAVSTASTCLGERRQKWHAGARVMRSEIMVCGCCAAAMQCAVSILTSSCHPF